MKLGLSFVSVMVLLMCSFSTSATDNSGPFPLLTLEEVGQMDLGGRLRYMELYRDTFLELEKIQNTFGQKIAFHVQPEQKFWHALFAVAEAQQTFARGANVTDRCIWAGNFQTYASQGVCQRPGCSREEEQRFGSGSVKCGLLATGSSECLSSNLAGNSTAECTRRAKSCASDNSASINSLLSTYDAGKPDVAALVRYACDAQVMAHLVRYVHTNGTSALPPDVATEFSRFNVNSEGLNGMVRAYQNHCAAAVDPSSLPAAARERAQKMKNATVADVIQPAECQTLKTRINTLNSRYENLSLQVPRAASGSVEKPSPQVQKPKEAIGAPTKLHPDKPAANVPPTAAALAQTPPSKSRVRENNPGGEGKVLQTSCPINPNRDMLSNRAMACAACVTDAQGLRGPQARKYSTLGTSSKWLSLIASMGPVCRGKPLNARETMYLLQGLGHCSAQAYNWTADDVTEGGATRNLVKDWQVGRNLEKANSKKFGEIYGISYKMAKNIFCPGIEAEYSRFSGDMTSYWVQRAAKVTEMDFKYSKESSDADFSYAKSGVHKCLTEAKANGSQLSLTQFDKECQGFAYAPAAAADYAVAKMEQELPVVAVNDDDLNECWVSQYATKREGAPSTVTFINPTSPERVATNSFNVIQYNSGMGANPKMKSLMTLASKDVCTKKSQVHQNYIAPRTTN